MTAGTFLRHRHATGRIIAVACAMLMTGLVAPESAHAAGAYAVDDSDISDPGTCGADSWASFSTHRDVVATTNLICGIPFVIPLEMSTEISRSNGSGSWATTVAPQVKINIIPSGVGAIGVGIAGGFTYNLTDIGTASTAVYIPVTLTPNDKVRINLNLGWLHDRVAHLDWLTWGVGAEFSVTDTVTLIGEVSGQSGHSVRPRSTAWPHVQAGIRVTPRESFDIDVIYGRNITGENRNWITLGLNVRF